MKNGQGKIVAIIILSICIVLGLGGVVFGIAKMGDEKIEPKVGKQMVLEGDGSQMVTSQEEAYQYLVDHADYFGIRNPEDTLHFAEKSEALGYDYYDFTQTYNGEMPVYGNRIVIMTDQDGKVILTSGVYEELDDDIDLKAEVSESELLEGAKDYLESVIQYKNVDNMMLHGEMVKLLEDNLYVYAREEEDDVLVVVYDVMFDMESGWQDFHVIADADTGEVYQAWSNIMTASESMEAKGLLYKDTVKMKSEDNMINVYKDDAENQYYMYDEERNIIVFDGENHRVYRPDEIMPYSNWKAIRELYFLNEESTRIRIPSFSRAESTKKFSAKAITLMDGIKTNYDWYEDHMNLKGWNGNNGLVLATYDVKFLNSEGKEYGENAGSMSFFSPDVTYLLYGDKYVWNRDIINHEYGHSVLRSATRTIKLSKNSHAGAINEAYADTMAVIVDNCINPDWISSPKKAKDNRNLADPHKSNNSRGGTSKQIGDKYYRNPNDLAGDFGGVHDNSTILSHASYLMMTGIKGTDATTLNGVQTAKLWYETIKLISHDDISFYEFGYLMSMVAKETLSDSQYQCVKEALTYVGVYDGKQFIHINDQFTLSFRDYYSDVLDEAEVTVYKMRKDWNGDYTNSESARVKTDKNGQVSLDLESGEFYRVEVTDAKYRSKAKKPRVQMFYVFCDKKMEKNAHEFSTEFREDVVKAFSFDKAELNLAVNGKGYVSTTILPERIAPKYYRVEWSSSDEAIVKVDKKKGTMTGVAEGTTTVKAKLTNIDKDGNEKAQFNQEVTVNVTKKQRDTVLVLDCSGSMSGKPMVEMKKSARKFCEMLLSGGGDSRVDIVTYDNNVSSSGFLKDLGALNDYIDGLDDGGGTNMYGALNRAEQDLSNYARSGSIQSIVIMSDGAPNDGGSQSTGVMTNWNASHSGMYGRIVNYGNAVCAFSDSLKRDNYVYSLGFFHGLNDSDKEYCSYLMNYLQNSGYYEVDKAENLQLTFEGISGQVSNGSKIVINIACPVDVEIVYGEETLSSAVSNYNSVTSFGKLLKEGISNEIKVIELDADKEYDISITGTDAGTMDYSISYFDENDVLTDLRTFESVPISVNTLIQCGTARVDDMELKIDGDGNGEVDSIWTAKSNSEGKKTWEDEDAMDECPEPVELKTGDSGNTVWIVLIICSTVVIVSAVTLLIVLLIVTSKRGEQISGGNMSMNGQSGQNVNPYANQGQYQNPNPYANQGQYQNPNSYANQGQYQNVNPYVNQGQYQNVNPYVNQGQYQNPNPYANQGQYQNPNPYVNQGQYQNPNSYSNRVAHPNPRQNQNLNRSVSSATAQGSTPNQVIKNGVQLLDGSMRGKKIELKQGCAYGVGKDPARAKVIIDRTYAKVSRLHCTVEYDNNKYYITDSSTNGTYLMDGTRIPQGKRTAVERGTIVYLAKKDCRIKLL